MNTNKVLIIILIVILLVMLFRSHIVVYNTQPVKPVIIPVPNPKPNPNPVPSPYVKPIGGCAGTRYGCCPNGSTPRVDASGSNC
jgi:hypothetical protein